MSISIFRLYSFRAVLSLIRVSADQFLIWSRNFWSFLSSFFKSAFVCVCVSFAFDSFDRFRSERERYRERSAERTVRKKREREKKSAPRAISQPSLLFFVHNCQMLLLLLLLFSDERATKTTTTTTERGGKRRKQEEEKRTITIRDSSFSVPSSSSSSPRALAGRHTLNFLFDSLSVSILPPKIKLLYNKTFYLVFLFQTLVALVQPIEDLLKHLLLLVDFAEGFVDFRLEFTDRRHFF